MNTLCSAIVVLSLHQLFFTSANAMHKANKSGSALEEVKFTDGQEYEAAVCTNSHEAQRNGGCCSITGYHQINPTKGYEFSIYIKSTASDTVNSFGFYVYNKNKERILNPNLSDPYFKKSSNDSNAWTKWTGYILPLYMSDSNNDSQPDSQFDETIGVDWKWPPYAKYVALRFGSCGSGSQKSETVIIRRSSHVPSPTSDHILLGSIAPPISNTPSGNTGVPPVSNTPFGDTDVSPASPTTIEISTTPPAPSPVDKTWYLFPDIQEFKTPLRPGHVGVWTFNISDFHEWDAKPNYTGKGYVNVHDTHTPIAKMVEGKERKCYYPWGITHLFEIDSSKSYEFSIWILSTQTELYNFLGFRAYDEDKNLLIFPLLPSDFQQYYSNITTKPYFKRSNNDTTEWTRWNGFVLPDEANDIPSHFRNGRNWKWPRGAKYAQLRFGTCYGKGNDQGITYFALPRVVQTDFQP